ncbi:MAG: hypothetical protein ACJASY_003470 [Halioglobus sp.]|jgi:hypothetical protein
MNWELVGAVAEIAGAVGVLITLVYLAIQIKDNTKSLQAGSLESVLDGPRDRYFLPMAMESDLADIYARGLNSLENLDAKEKRRFFYLIYEQIFQMQQVMHLHERDLIPKVDFDAWIYYTSSLLRTPGGAEMWPHCEKVVTSTIADLINNQLRENALDPSFIDMIPLFRVDEPQL